MFKWIEAKYRAPLVGASSAPRMCKSVLLPAPEVPTMASISPRRTLKLNPSKSRRRPRPVTYSFRRSRTSSRAFSVPNPGVHFFVRRGNGNHRPAHTHVYHLEGECESTKQCPLAATSVQGTDPCRYFTRPRCHPGRSHSSQSDGEGKGLCCSAEAAPCISLRLTATSVTRPGLFSPARQDAPPVFCFKLRHDTPGPFDISAKPFRSRPSLDSSALPAQARPPPSPPIQLATWSAITATAASAAIFRGMLRRTSDRLRQLY